MTQFIFSNVNIYAAIADEAFAEMEEGLKEGRKPRPDGNGWINKFDPNQKSFKKALVYITFSAMWLEAMLHLRIAEKHGKSRSKQVDRQSYEEKLEILGINDHELSCLLCEFRDLRREIIHEKSFFDQKKFRVAQKEARKIRQMMQEIQERLAEDDLL